MPQFDVIRRHTTVHRVEAKSDDEAEHKVDNMDDPARRKCENRGHFDHDTVSFEVEEVEDDDSDDEE